MMKYGVLDAKILKIDVSSGNHVLQDTSAYRRFIGGRGVNQHILLQELSRSAEPLSPENVIVLGAGMLCGTNAPAVARVNVDTKNIFTGGIASSNAGGGFGSALKRAGIGHVVIVGRAAELSVLYISADKIEVVPAPFLQHRVSSDTQRVLQQLYGTEIHTLVIGPAGEHQVWGSVAIVDGARVFGRCGIGAVLGAKNLKAIVVRGNREIDIKDPLLFSDASQRILEKVHANAFLSKRMQVGVYSYDIDWGDETPFRNFSGESPPEGKKKRLGADDFDKYKTAQRGCDGCPISCWTTHEVSCGTEDAVGVESLQINDVKNFGAKLDMDDPEQILLMHQACNEYGLDVDVTANVIAWAIDCFKRGLLDEDETDGLLLDWGDAEVIRKLVEKIAWRDGFGNALAEGCHQASLKLGRGSEQWCAHIRGNDLYECLWKSIAWSLGTTVAARGGTHTRGAASEERLGDCTPEKCLELFGVVGIDDPSAYRNKERLVVFMERLNAVFDSIGICMYAHSQQPDLVMLDDYADLVKAASGIDTTAAGLMLVGERITTLERCFNVLHSGWSRADDFPPDHFFTVKLSGKYGLDKHEWDRLLDRYYDQHLWDVETGCPTEATLHRLSLDDVREQFRQG
jgi:aldehyde:ferredoxin oxidoreductase